MIEDIYSLETEQHALGGLFNNTEALTEIDFFVKETDFFQKVHQTIYLVLRGMLLSNERVDAVLLANKISSYGTKHNGDLSIFEYIELLSYKKPTKEATIEAFKNVIGFRIRRQCIEVLRGMARLVQRPGELSTKELISKLDKTYGDWSTTVLKNQDRGQIEICSGVEELIEGTRNNPPKEESVLYGPFDTVNRLIGSISKPSNITVVGARSGSCKSAMGLFYQAHLCINNGLECLLMDSGEMTPTDIRFRLVCMLTSGKVPMHHLEMGTWANNEEWATLTRAAIEQAKKIKIHYEQVSGLKASEVISLLRRYSYKIGRDKIFLPCFDYLKAMDSEDGRSSEWATLGSFVQQIKTFITDEIPLPFWTSIQLNRSGVVTNKKDTELNDSEAAFGLSDRVLQQSSHSILLRYKINSEVEEEGGQFGNMKMHFLKTRSLGKDYMLANTPVKLPSGKFVRNYINIAQNSFSFQDLGDVNQMVQKMKMKYSLSDKKPKNLEEGDIL